MAGQLFYLPRPFVIDGAGAPRSGAKAYFYNAGTLTAKNTYSDSALTTPNANPVVADAGGVFGPIYLEQSSYRLILKDSLDVELYDQDNINVQSIGFGSEVESKSGNYTVTTDDNGKFIEVDATGTISLPAVADAGEGFTLAIFNTGTGIVTVDGNLAETVNNVATVILNPGEGIICACDGDEWLGVVSRVFGNKINSQSGAYTILTSDRGAVVVAPDAGTKTLPTVADAGAGFSVVIANTHSAAITVDGDGAETINGVAGYSVAPGEGAVFFCSGTAWFAVGTQAATASLPGVVELATAAEVQTGTDAVRAVTPDALANTIYALRILNAGDASPSIESSNAGASGWSVADGNQTGEAVVTHNLGLSDINQLIVVATVDYGADPGAVFYVVDIEDTGVNSFQVQVMSGSTAPAIAAWDGAEINIIAYQVP